MAAPSNAINSLQEAQPMLDELGKLRSELQDVVAAVNQGRAPPPPSPTGQRPPRAGDRPTSALPRPNPKFDGCWHCGKKHPGGRRQCRIFKALIQKHKGLPPGYQGTYEKGLEKQQRPTVNAVQEATADAEFVIAAIPDGENHAGDNPDVPTDHPIFGFLDFENIFC